MLCATRTTWNCVCESQKLRDELLSHSLVLEDSHDRKLQSNQFAKLAEIVQQEVLLRLMAVRREPAVLVFPPFRRTKEIKEALPPGHAVLSFFAMLRQAYALLITPRQVRLLESAQRRTTRQAGNEAAAGARGAWMRIAKSR